MRLPSPEDIGYILSLPVVVNYWPLFLGGAVMFLFAAKGWNWAMLPVGALFILFQIWHAGGFA